MVDVLHKDLTGADLHEPKPHAITHNSVEILGNQDPLSLDASQITTGTVSTARLGSGTASVSTWLRGDNVWAPAPAAGGVLPSLVTGRYYDTGLAISVTQTTSKAIVANTIYGTPFYLPVDTTFDQIAVALSTANGTGLRLGIYDVTATYLPGALIVDAGEVSSASTGVKTIALSPEQALTEGWYWLAIVSNGSFNVYGFSSAEQNILGQSSVDSTNDLFGVTGTHTYAALPDPFPAIGYATSAPKIALRVT